MVNYLNSEIELERTSQKLKQNYLLQGIYMSVFPRRRSFRRYEHLFGLGWRGMDGEFSVITGDLSRSHESNKCHYFFFSSHYFPSPKNLLEQIHRDWYCLNLVIRKVALN